jgi:positive regulator of sigma E activity
MNKYYKFIFRAVLSVVFAFFIAQFFFNNKSFITIAALAAALLGFSYLFEYIRQRDQERGS